MAQRKTLTEQQLAVLQWIGDGCPDRVMEDYAHRISAAALHRRGFVEVWGRRSNWEASITVAGRDYLERSKGPDAPIPRQANIPVTEELVNQVIAAGGTLIVEDEQGPGAVDYWQRAEAAKRHDKVPPGQQLCVRRTKSGQIEIQLEDRVPGVHIETSPVPVREKVARYHPAVRHFRDQRERHEVSRALLPRALRVLNALAVEAEARL